MQETADRVKLCCPLNGKLCVGGRREDFPKDEVGSPTQCRWWVHVAGKDPQSEKMVDMHDCSVPWFVTIQIETSQMVRQGTATTDVLKNIVFASLPPETQKNVSKQLPSLAMKPIPSADPAALLENKNGAHE